MRAGILAAGIGQRLKNQDLPPKVLLQFDGETLLARHIAILRHCGVKQIDVIVGYRAEEIEQELTRIGANDIAVTHYNPDFKQGAIVSLSLLRPAFTAGDAVLFMDGDVLYDHRMIERLLASPQGNCFLMDRDTEEGDDPVRLCMNSGSLVDFHKRPQREHHWWGEWVGFCRFTPDVAAKVIEAAGRYIDDGQVEAIYEEAIRDVVISEPLGTFGVEDITGIPWVEIDFPEDLTKARQEIYPNLLAIPRCA